MTDPLGTVMLEAVEIAPTVSPTAVSALVAAACGWLTTSGTATCGRPVEMTSATALPMTTSAPAAGSWLMTAPLGTVMLDAVVMAPTVKPAAVRALVAAACGWLTTSGTATCGRPEETTSATALPMTTSAPAAGSWLMTDPLGTVMLDAVVIAPTVSPTPVSAVVAAACGELTTFGTATCGRPEEMTSATALPMTTSAPAAGSWLMTDPLGTVMLDAVVMPPTVSPTPVSALVAAACA